MRDPFGSIDSFGSLDPFSSRIAPSPSQPLSDSDTESAMGALTSGALSGIGYVGSTIDKLFGGRAIRGGLHSLLGGGTPRELLSIIPGSDYLGLTDFKDSTPGDQLWKDVGYDPSQGNWLERNLVGPATEIALDPSMYLGGIGSLTKAGKLAAKTSEVTKGFLPSIAAGERTLMHGLTGPGVADQASKLVGVARGTVDQARRVPGVSTVLDRGSSAVDWTGLHLRSLFDPLAGPEANRTVQAANEFTRVPARDAAIETARRNKFDLDQLLQPALDAGARPEDLWRYATQVGEGVTPRATVIPHEGLVNDAVSQLKDLYGGMGVEERSLGLRSKEFGSLVDTEYMRQRMNKMSGGGGGGGGTASTQPFKTTSASQLPRKKIFDVPGGRVQLEDWIRDPLMSGEKRMGTPEEVGATILEKYMGHAGEEIPTRTFPINYPKVAASRSRGLAKYLGNVQDQFIDLAGRDTPTVPFFSHDLTGNYLDRATQSANTTSAAQAIHDVIKRVGTTAGGDVPVTQTLKAAGLTGRGAVESALRALGENPDDLIIQAAEAGADSGLPFNELKALRDTLSTYGMPQAEHDATTRYMNRFTTPHEVAPWATLGDSLMNLSKKGLYTIWPASHVRNEGSILYENALGGTMPWNPAYKEARAALRGEGLTGYADQAAGFVGPPLTPELQRSAFIRDMYAKGLIDAPKGPLDDTVGMRASPTVGSRNPALPRVGVMEAAKPWLEWKGAIKDPFGVAGVGGRTESTNPFVRAGEGVGKAVEEQGRSAQFLDLRRKGYSVDAAAEMVNKTHFDYSNLSDFENNYMKRLVPFYSFSRFNIPKQFKRALQEPGKISVPSRFAGGGEGEGYVPQYLRSGMALPLGTEEDGTQRYASQLGLPFEEALSRLKVGSGPMDTASKSLEGLMGMLRPDLKFLLESATGRSFGSGRDLADLRPGTLESTFSFNEDQAGALSQLLANTPASRMISTANRMLDSRKDLPTKALSLLTGVKLSDVDAEKWKSIDARHELEKMMQGQANIRTHTDYYANPEAKASGTITPEQAYELQLYAALRKRARDAAEAKKIGVQVQP